MKRYCLYWVTLGMTIFLVNSLVAQTKVSDGTGLNYVHSAHSLEQGLVTLRSLSITSSRTADFADSSVSVWSNSARVNLAYGVADHLEIIASPILFQNTNLQGGPVNTPDDFLVSLKYGSLGGGNSGFTFGSLFSLRLPTGFVQNIPLEPYSGSRVSFGLKGLVSYSTEPQAPQDALGAHLNLGYWFHNDNDAEIVKGGQPSTRPTSNTQELQFAAGVRVPGQRVEFSAELYGTLFLSRPPVSAYSRENYLFIAPTVYYKPVSWIKLHGGFDLRLLNEDDSTVYLPSAGGVPRLFPDPHPNYPSWRLNLGVQFSLSTSEFYRSTGRHGLIKRVKTRQELFEEIISSQKEAESAEAELERIRSHRLRAEQELEKLRRILEEEASKAQSPEDVPEED